MAKDEGLMLTQQLCVHFLIWNAYIYSSKNILEIVLVFLVLSINLMLRNSNAYIWVVNIYIYKNKGPCQKFDVMQK